MDFDFRIIEYEIMRNKSDYCTLNVFNCIDNYFISNKIIKCCVTKITNKITQRSIAYICLQKLEFI